MGSTALSLTNRVLRHFNEVELDSTTFSTATGFHSAAKDYVNDAIRSVQQSEYEWPFNWAETTVTIVPGQTDPQLYSLHADAESVDWETFTLVRDDSLAVPETYLKYIDYDEWFQRHRDTDKSQVGSATLGIQLPSRVFRTQDLKFGITPVPDRAYQVKYQYWGFTSELTAHGDTTTIPSRFDHVITAGAIADVYMFRSNMQAFNMYKKKHTDGISKMRELLINRYKRVRDNRVGGSG